MAKRPNKERENVQGDLRQEKSRRKVAEPQNQPEHPVPQNPRLAPRNQLEYQKRDPKLVAGDIKKLQDVNREIKSGRLTGGVRTPDQAYAEGVRQYDPKDTSIEAMADIRTRHAPIEKHKLGSLGNTPTPKPRPNHQNDEDEARSSTPNPFSIKPKRPGEL